ncbi:hypothetical protein [Tenacibaculum sp. SZ-18]|uniref:hypothetical protein n=1 Tax=Tenacibaculum sp. SZ-18 TaxID=754423 RepID=UPI0012FD6283|nr:hypothetical protein [Tenacibaculum sp. SZ-18]
MICFLILVINYMVNLENERIKFMTANSYVKSPIKNLVNNIKKYYPDFKFEESIILQ